MVFLGRRELSQKERPWGKDKTQARQRTGLKEKTKPRVRP